MTRPGCNAAQRRGRPAVTCSVSRFRRVMTIVALLAGVLAVEAPALAVKASAADDSQIKSADLEAELPTAPVVIDGKVLFRVRGTSAFPAERRAAVIAERIATLAADRAVSADAVHPVEIDIGTAIAADGHRLMVVGDSDAQLESVQLKVLAQLFLSAIRQAVVDYRQARSREALVGSAARGGAATAILAVLAALVVWLSRRTQTTLEALYQRRVQSVDIQSFQVVRAEQIWVTLRRALVGARVIVILVLAFVYLQYVLALFPWTRGTGNQLLGYVLRPLGIMGRGAAGAIPDILFLAVLFLVTRYLLKVVHLFFGAVGRGEVKFKGFETEWADPTYKLLRIAIVALALVVAYPYIPGSGSEAFKGISIFIGILFSLGSSSTIANVIAGYTMTYRRAFRLGDRVKISGTMGDVTEMRLQVTHLRTIKNEEVIIPNSTILNNEVVNYSSLARTRGLILHTTVGIGYETPWRQVEAMLLLAAERTPGLMREPAPFVRQTALGDFAVTYEINGYCNNAQATNAIYTELHRNILDIFNEHGVQIMTPAYEGDPEAPKVVPKDQWFVAPAKAAEPDTRKPAVD
jgi:small-conductance mechanosensitive channel